ncbi:MAG: Leu/Phe/Val dehydrogenase [Nevskiales bacterium]
MAVFANPAFKSHEAVFFAHAADSGLRAIIAIHSTALGPALGGCRMWDYESEQAALTDVLRLSRGMSYKNALAGLPLGGGKAVILGDARRDKWPAMLDAYGQFVESLGGRYVTAQDVGLTEPDMICIARHTRHVGGGAAGGNPAPKTAHGVFRGITVAVRHALERDSLDGLMVAVQGLGSVGLHLCRELHAAGAQLVVADLNPVRVEQARDELGAQAASIEDILLTPADVLAPCALGGVLNATSIAQLNVKVVAGAANNQLATDADGERLQRRGILYAPDYVINAGGVISVGADYLATLSEEEVWRKIERIGDTLEQVFAEAERSGEASNRVADRLAEARLASGKMLTRQVA